MYPVGGRINVLLLYFHRLYRFIPPMISLMLIALFLFQHLGDGPIFYNTTHEQVVENCEKHWWANLLFV